MLHQGSPETQKLLPKPTPTPPLAAQPHPPVLVPLSPMSPMSISDPPHHLIPARPLTHIAQVQQPGDMVSPQPNNGTPTGLGSTSSIPPPALLRGAFGGSCDDLDITPYTIHTVNLGDSMPRTEATYTPHRSPQANSFGGQGNSSRQDLPPVPINVSTPTRVNAAFAHFQQEQQQQQQQQTTSTAPLGFSKASTFSPLSPTAYGIPAAQHTPPRQRSIAPLSAPGPQAAPKPFSFSRCGAGSSCVPQSPQFQSAPRVATPLCTVQPMDNANAQLTRQAVQQIVRYIKDVTNCIRLSLILSGVYCGLNAVADIVPQNRLLRQVVSVGKFGACSWFLVALYQNSKGVLSTLTNPAVANPTTPMVSSITQPTTTTTANTTTVGGSGVSATATTSCLSPSPLSCAQYSPAATPSNYTIGGGGAGAWSRGGTPAPPPDAKGLKRTASWKK